MACLRELPEEPALRLLVAAWQTVLAPVPVTDLLAAYQAAWRLPDRRPGFPVTADEILIAWQHQHSRRYRLVTAEDFPHA